MQMQIMNAPKMGRVMRKPQHTFQVRHRPWQIQPHMIAPVLPGETMVNLLMQARVVTDPIKNPLVGWWLEYHYFFVKLRDLDDRDSILPMFTEPNYVLPGGLTAAARVETYHNGGTIDWLSKALDRIVTCYFRDDMTLGNFNIGTLPACQIGRDSWLDSAKLGAAGVVEDLLPGGQQEADPRLSPEYDAAFVQWQQMRAMKLTNMTYDDYLRTHGIKENVVEEPLNDYRPELIRSVREWSYPSNTVEPTTGVPSSALSWGVAERADKDRMFKEPGFIVGVTIARPKVYLSNQKSTAARMLTDAFAWLPALVRDHPYTTLKQFPGVAATDGPLGAVPGAGYWVDVKDLFLYGDQFVNFDLAAVDGALVALPPPDLAARKYPTGAMADALFTDPGKNLIRQDGVVNLSIKGALTETT